MCVVWTCGNSCNIVSLFVLGMRCTDNHFSCDAYCLWCCWIVVWGIIVVAFVMYETDMWCDVLYIHVAVCHCVSALMSYDCIWPIVCDVVAVSLCHLMLSGQIKCVYVYYCVWHHIRVFDEPYLYIYIYIYTRIYTRVFMLQQQYWHHMCVCFICEITCCACIVLWCCVVLPYVWGGRTLMGLFMWCVIMLVCNCLCRMWLLTTRSVVKWITDIYIYTYVYISCHVMSYHICWLHIIIVLLADVSYRCCWGTTCRSTSHVLFVITWLCFGTTHTYYYYMMCRVLCPTSNGSEN